MVVSCRQTALANAGRRLDQGGGGRNRAAEGIHRRPLVDYTLAAALLFHGVENLIEGRGPVHAGQLLLLAVPPPEFRVVRDAEHDVPAIGGEEIALGLAGSHCMEAPLGGGYSMSEKHSRPVACICACLRQRRGRVAFREQINESFSENAARRWCLVRSYVASWE